MADSKISQLTALTSTDAASTDVLPIVDTSATTTKKISLADISEYVIDDIIFPAGVEDLDDLGDVTAPTPVTDDLLRYNGSAWVNSAKSTALSGYATLSSPTFTGTVSGITKSMVGLSNVDNTSDVDKPVSSATTTALNLKANLASPTFTGTPAAPTPAAGSSSTQIATTAFADPQNDQYVLSAAIFTS